MCSFLNKNNGTPINPTLEAVIHYGLDLFNFWQPKDLYFKYEGPYYEVISQHNVDSGDHLGSYL